MRRSRTVCIVGLALVTVMACADDRPWQKPNVSVEQRARDQAACRRLATSEAERDLVLREERSSRPRDNRTGTYTKQMNQFSAGKDRDDLYNRCMARSGYKRAPGSDPKSRFEALSEPQPQPQPQSQPR